MMSSITTVVAVLVLLAFLPVTIKWIQRRIGGDSTRVVQASSVVSAVAVGPSQRVVTVEVLNQLVRENPANMTGAIRAWLGRGTPPSR